MRRGTTESLTDFEKWPSIVRSPPFDWKNCFIAGEGDGFEKIEEISLIRSSKMSVLLRFRPGAGGVT